MADLAIVVGDVRDRRGALRGLPWITAQALTDAGMSLYQDATILDPHGSLQMIAGRTMRASRKLTRLHQYLIVALQGRPSPRRSTPQRGLIMPRISHSRVAEGPDFVVRRDDNIDREDETPCQ